MGYKQIGNICKKLSVFGDPIRQNNEGDIVPFQKLQISLRELLRVGKVMKININNRSIIIFDSGYVHNPSAKINAWTQDRGKKIIPPQKILVGEIKKY